MMASQNQTTARYNRYENPIVWIDLETTGNEVFRDTILEIAVIITDQHLREAHPGIQYVIKTDDQTLNSMHPECIKMHADSGLTAECKQSPHTKEFVRDQVLAYIQEYVPKFKGVIGGSSVHFDKTILMREMPLITDWLKYQILDVSSCMFEARAQFPTLSPPRPATSRRHRAMDDIRNSIAQLKFYRTHFYKTPREAAYSVNRAGVAAPSAATGQASTPNGPNVGDGAVPNNQRRASGAQRTPSGGQVHGDRSYQR